MAHRPISRAAARALEFLGESPDEAFTSHQIATAIGVSRSRVYVVLAPLEVANYITSWIDAPEGLQHVRRYQLANPANRASAEHVRLTRQRSQLALVRYEDAG